MAVTSQPLGSQEHCTCPQRHSNQLECGSFQEIIPTYSSPHQQQSDHPRASGPHERQYDTWNNCGIENSTAGRSCITNGHEAPPEGLSGIRPANYKDCGINGLGDVRNGTIVRDSSGGNKQKKKKLWSKSGRNDDLSGQFSC